MPSLPARGSARSWHGAREAWNICTVCSLTDIWKSRGKGHIYGSSTGKRNHYGQSPLLSALGTLSSEDDISKNIPTHVEPSSLNPLWASLLGFSEQESRDYMLNLASRILQNSEAETVNQSHVVLSKLTAGRVGRVCPRVHREIPNVQSLIITLDNGKHPTGERGSSHNGSPEGPPRCI